MIKKPVIAAAIALSSLIGLGAQAAPQTYVVDGSHTFPSFSYNHMGMSTQLSKFNNTKGKVVYDKDAKTAQVDIEIDMTSVDTGFEPFNEHIQGEDFLDTAKFPVATFKSTKVIFEDGKPSKIEGDLTIKGVTKPVTLNVTQFANMAHPMMKKDAIGANAYTVIKRSDFNAGKYVPLVGDDVRIQVSLEAIAE